MFNVNNYLLDLGVCIVLVLSVIQSISQVSTHVALDHQTDSALAQDTQITWPALLKCDEHYRVERWGLGLHWIIIQHT